MHMRPSPGAHCGQGLLATDSPTKPNELDKGDAVLSWNWVYVTTSYRSNTQIDLMSVQPHFLAMELLANNTDRVGSSLACLD